MTSAKPKVLLVEDEVIVSMLTENMLANLGYEVSLSAASLESGLRAAAEGDFDIAVLDVNLRGKLSFPIADVLAERGVPFVFVSGYSSTGIETRYAQIPALQKPFTADGLELTLSHALQQQL
jgi:DNA-binding response OmpR family regulator